MNPLRICFFISSPSTRVRRATVEAVRPQSKKWFAVQAIKGLTNPFHSLFKKASGAACLSGHL
jgi:hypothetical protein